ncbi:MAG: hypothetical protein QNJ44_13135 [Rhodobacter sp.]|nr:hypothetical protein [Rhodobacter sp.]
MALVTLAGILLQPPSQNNTPAGRPQSAGDPGPRKLYQRNWVLVSASILVVILLYLVLARLSEQRAVNAAQSDVESLLAANGQMSFEDIYAEISPRRELTILTSAIDKGLGERTIFAVPQSATLADNRLVGVRLYKTNADFPSAGRNAAGN